MNRTIETMYTPAEVLRMVTVDWKVRHLILQKDFKLLIEAYRRFHMFVKPDGKGLDGWTGLGHGEYERCKYFQVVGTRQPRCLAWFRLTRSGKLLISDLNARLPWKEEYGIHIFNM